MAASLAPYLKLVAGTADDLAFLLDNLGQKITLAPNLACLEQLESLLLTPPSHQINAATWPDWQAQLVPLLARYAAIVLISHTACAWSTAKGSGEPSLEIIPGEDWHHFLPLHWQRVLLPTGTGLTLTRAVQRLLDEHQKYSALLLAVTEVLSRTGGLAEARLLEDLQQAGVAPDPRFFAVAARAFPKRVANVLRRSKKFKYAKASDLWQVSA